MRNTELEVKLAIEKHFSKESPEILQSFDLSAVSEYLQFLESNNEVGGFFSKGDSEKILERHLLECLYFAFRVSKVLEINPKTTILDVGTGPGLPGVLFHYLSSSPQVSLLDSQKKRLSLLETWMQTRNEKQKPKFYYERIEEFPKKFSVVITRSVIQYPWSIEVLSNSVASKGHYVPFLGKQIYQRDDDILKYSGFREEKTEILEELAFLGMRHIKYLKKVSNPKNGFPRPWKKVLEEIQEYGKNRID